MKFLFPNAKPSLDQVLLLFPIHMKTNSNGSFESCYEISYTVTVFVADKWDESAELASV